MTTHTRLVNFRAMSNDQKASAVVLKLMMACNDMSVAKESFDLCNALSFERRPGRKRGMLMYFLRLQVSHLYEALLIIQTIQKDVELMSRVEECDSRTQASFGRLVTYVKGGTNERLLEDLIGQIRSNLVFHYDESGKLISRAIADRGMRSSARFASITRGHSPYEWHFDAADDVVDSIVLRQIWKIPREEPLEAAVDAIGVKISQIFTHFFDFAGEFIWTHSKYGH